MIQEGPARLNHFQIRRRLEFRCPHFGGEVTSNGFCLGQAAAEGFH